MSIEKRRFSRIPFSVTTEIHVNNLTYKTNKINDLSVGGCLLPISEDIKVGSECLVVIHLSGTGSKLEVQVNGEIVRNDSEMIAVKFTGIETDSLFHLQNIVRYNALNTDEIEKELRCHPGLI
ncbi:MAG: PilZ domain-containing protein [Deltaproteobacteria bacterium]|nr:PilZ domain-containing protein [Deltaproteobacteria bacterium]MBW2661513.1 PilZ domain-containing protein [Deltaproteobacteria bacterium]